jgi:hypothetical protein
MTTSPKKRTPTKKASKPVEKTEESSAPVVEKKIYRLEKVKHIPLDIYMLAKGVPAHHLPAMKKFAGRRRNATAEQWEKLFSNY